MRPYADMHCDTISKIAYIPGNGGLFENKGHIDLKSLNKGGCAVQFFACFIDAEVHREHSENELWDRCWQSVNGLIDVYEREIEINENFIRKVQCAADIDNNMKYEKISAVLAIEEGGIINEDMERLWALYKRGVRLITLTWNYENCIGFPNSTNAECMRRGLKPFGVEIIEEMQRLGMIVDVSHLSDGGFWDVASVSEKRGIPFAVSHSCARALKNHPRNLTDSMLRVVGQTGSVVGVNFCDQFLNDTGYSDIDSIVRHIIYMVNTAGSESVGFGTDFDGIDSRLEIDKADKMPLLIDALGKAGLSAAVIDKICYQNVLRVIREVIK